MNRKSDRRVTGKGLLIGATHNGIHLCFHSRPGNPHIHGPSVMGA